MIPQVENTEAEDLEAAATAGSDHKHVQEVPMREWRVKLKRVERRIKAITSVVVKFFVLLLFFFGSLFIVIELSDSSYSIQEIQVPEHFSVQGYTDQVVAHRISDKLVEIITRERFAEEALQYSNSFDQDDISVDIAGAGIPLRAFVNMIGGVFGIHKKRLIRVEITMDRDTAILRLKIHDNRPQRYTIPMKGSLERAVETIGSKAAESILMHSSPYVLARHYLFRDSEGNYRLSEFLFENHRGDDRLERVAYFSLTGAYLTDGKLDLAENAIRKGVDKFPEDLNLNAALGTILERLGRAEECLLQQRKVVRMFSSSTTKLRRMLALSNLGLAHSLNNNIDSAVYYLERAREVDPEAGVVYLNLARVHLLFREDTALFYQNIEQALRRGFKEPIARHKDLGDILTHDRMQSLFRKY